MTISINYKPKETSSTPVIVVAGTTDSIQRGLIKVTHHINSFPNQFYEVNNGHFKALVHLSPGENSLKFQTFDGQLDRKGFPVVNGGALDELKMVLNYTPYLQNKPVHLCLLVGKDSPGTYDIPSYKKSYEPPSLKFAIQKLKIAGRLMQAYTQEEMRSNGFGNRCFRFDEEWTPESLSRFDYNDKGLGKLHSDIKIHVLRSEKTVKELRDANLAQQNPKGNNTGGLFGIAAEAIRKYPFIDNSTSTPVQCAVLYLDSTWDKKQKLILTHAALGGGMSDIKLAIFGSHGIHSWPNFFEEVVPCLLDDTKLSTDEVANDCNECGSSWECLTVTMGAFMHEIGHHLGLPHREYGVMLRDYPVWNRSFSTRELAATRTGKQANSIPPNGKWEKLCHWHELDILRFLYHDSFSLPQDAYDNSFVKVHETTGFSALPAENYFGRPVSAPTSYNTTEGLIVKSSGGIYLLELIVEDLARSWIGYYPKSFGGAGLQFEMNLNYNELAAMLPPKHKGKNFEVHLLSLSGDLTINDFKPAKNVLRSDFGLGRGVITGFKSATLGSAKGDERISGFLLDNVISVRVYHGGALDGIRFYTENTPVGSGATPPVPPRNYLNKMVNKLSLESVSNSSLIGNEKPHYSDWSLQPGEKIVKMNFRNGQWVDAVQFVTNTGRMSPMYGNANGGHLSTLDCPGGYKCVGMYCYTGRWVDGLGIVYSNEI